MDVSTTLINDSSIHCITRTNGNYYEIYRHNSAGRLLIETWLPDLTECLYTRAVGPTHEHYAFENNKLFKGAVVLYGGCGCASCSAAS